MRIGGYNKQVDFERLGGALVLAASVILAIRTAKKESLRHVDVSNRDWEEEVDHALKLAHMLMAHATARYPQSFRQKDVPWYVPEEEDQPK